MKTVDFKDGNIVFPIGEQGSKEMFTGEAWVCILMQATEHMPYLIAEVKFTAGARTYWHTHPIEQILLCTDGEGFYQEKGKPAVRLKKGDVFVIPPEVEHWHGAAADSRFAHVAITNYKDGKNVVWCNPVSYEEYAEVNQ